MAILSASRESRSGTINLVENGWAQAIVVTADEPSETAEYAAQELIRHIKMSTGVKLDIAVESNIPPAGYPHRVFIGVCEAAEKAGVNLNELPYDASLVKAVGSDLFLLGHENDQDPLSTGNERSGTLFAVYDFLENVLQARWLWPGESGTYVPRKNDVKVPAGIDHVSNPAISRRSFSGSGGWRRYRSRSEREDYRKDLSAFVRRHRIAGPGRRGSPVHSFRRWWDRYGDEHPEWFAMDEEGKRDGSRGMCVSNPELHQFIVDVYLDKDSPEREGRAGSVWRHDGWISLGDLDSSWRPCKCEDCLAWDGPMPENITFGRNLYNAFGHHHTSDRYGRFYQAVYEKAAEHDPEVRVSGYLYWTYFFAPAENLEIDPGVYGYFCPWGHGTGGPIIFFPLSDEALEWKKEQWLGWADTGMSLVYRPNHWHGGYVMPHVERQGPEFFQWAYENGMVGFHFDALFDHWSPQSETFYLYFRLFADPTQEIQDILSEYYEAFGPAAEQVKEYFDYWHEYTLERPGGDLRWVQQAAIAYPEEVFSPAEAMLEKGLTAAKKHPRTEYAQRVRYLMIGLEHARLASRFWDTMESIGTYSARLPEDSEGLRKTAEAWRKLQAFRFRHRNSHAVNFDIALASGRGDIRAIRPDYETLQEKVEILREEAEEQSQPPHRDVIF